MTLVLGATGTQGGAVARALLGTRNEVAALVRDPGSDRAQALASAGARLITGVLAGTWSAPGRNTSASTGEPPSTTSSC